MAQRYLGEYYNIWMEAFQDYFQAVKLSRPAAERGYTEAQVNMAD
jgi:TPR repeat protein